MGKILPLVLVLVGLSGGVGAGYLLKPVPEVCAADDTVCLEKEAEAKETAESEAEVATEYAELNRQFIIPLLRGERVASLVVASLAVEVTEGETASVYDKEPKIRDAFLQIMFVHAHSGGFDGDFTSARSMKDLKTRLVEAAEPILGKVLKDVLITEIVRQDM
ncbi:MAG: flagellar basal body-associated FliL family protein [Pseudomonadota bacterium]